MDPHALDEVNYIEIDGVRCISFSFVAAEAGRQARNGYRYWQAFYNILTELGQSGVPSPWPELFYEEDHGVGLGTFHSRMDVIDDFIFPRSGESNVVALVVQSTPPLADLIAA